MASWGHWDELAWPGPPGPSDLDRLDWPGPGRLGRAGAGQPGQASPESPTAKSGTPKKSRLKPTPVKKSRVENRTGLAECLEKSLEQTETVTENDG